MKVQVAGGDNRVIDPGMYRVKCTAVVAEDAPNDAFGKTKKFRIVLKTTEVTDEEGEGIELERVVNRAFTSAPKKSNLFIIFEAFGLPVNDQVYEPDTDDLLGKEANAVVVDHVSERDGSQWSRIETIVPLPKTNGARQSAPTSPVEGAEPPLADALAEAAVLAQWTESVRAIGYTTKEIIDHSQAKYGRGLNELTAVEREALAKELGVAANPAPF